MVKKTSFNIIVIGVKTTTMGDQDQVQLLIQEQVGFYIEGADWGWEVGDVGSVGGKFLRGDI